MEELKVIKVIMLMKRKPGMTIPDFRHYYENNHRVIGENILTDLLLNI